MKSIESIDKTAKSIGAFDSINYGVYYRLMVHFQLHPPVHQETVIFYSF